MSSGYDFGVKKIILFQLIATSAISIPPGASCCGLSVLRMLQERRGRLMQDVTKPIEYTHARTIQNVYACSKSNVTPVYSVTSSSDSYIVLLLYVSAK